MADEEKRKRKQCKSNFTRSANSIEKLIDDGALQEIVKPQFDNFQSLWQRLENAHDDFIEKLDDAEEDEQGLLYLNEPGERHTTILLKYSTYLKGQVEGEKEYEKKKVEADRLLEEERRKREAREAKEAEEASEKKELTKRFESMKLEVAADVDTFVRMTKGLQDSLKEASDRDKRNQWERVESEFKLVRSKYVELVKIDSSNDVADLRDQFGKEVEPLYIETQQWVLSQLKDSTFRVKKLPLKYYASKRTADT